MKIGTRLFIYLAVPLTILVVLFGDLDQRHDQAVLRQELARGGSVLSHTIRIAVQDALRDRRDQDVRDLADQLSGYGGVLGVRVFDAGGGLRYQSSRLPARLATLGATLADTLADPRSRDRLLALGGLQVRSIVQPLDPRGPRPAGAIEVLQLESIIDAESRASRRAIVLHTIALILAMGTVLLIVTRLSVAQPIEDLVGSIREARSGHLRARAAIDRGDEFGRLALELNALGERLETTQRSLLEEQESRRRMEARLRQAERLAGLGRLAAGLAHEIGTPLNVIGGRTESLLRWLAGNDRAEKHLGIISAQIDRIDRIVRGMLDFARVPEPRLQRTDAVELARTVLEFLESRFEHDDIRVQDEIPPGLAPIEADPDQLQQVFLNIGTNAADAMPRGGVLRVGARTEWRAHADGGGREREFLALSFEDSGVGIPREHLDRVFDPFFTTKEAGRGTGLGMSISYGIVREHGGWIELESASGRGTRVTIHLPTDGPVPAAVAAAESHAS